MVGVMPTCDARLLAERHGLDLVELSPNADPPVCRIMDFGKYRYDESRKLKDAKKKQQNHQVKEVKFHANVAEHDYETKLNHICNFLEKGHKVKVSLTFRGRENAHRDLGFELMKRVMEESAEHASVDMQPKMVGRSIVAMLSPRSAKA